MLSSKFIQLQEACNYYVKIETPTQVFSCEFCKMFKINSFKEQNLLNGGVFPDKLKVVKVSSMFKSGEKDKLKS